MKRGPGAMPRARLVAACAAILAAALLSAGCKKGPSSRAERRERDMTAQQLYDKGMNYFEHRHYYRARTVLDKALSKPGVTRDLVADINLALADAYFYDGGIINVAEALSRYTSFLTFYPAHPKADYAQYQLGLSYLKQALGPDKDQETTRKALAELQKVARDWPDSEWADKARVKVAEARERLAESEMRVGLFYLKRNAYAGAIDRFKKVLEDYPGYSRIDRSYYMLADALRSNKKRDEALLYYQKVVELFPQSRYVGAAQDAISEMNKMHGSTAEASKNRSDASGNPTQPTTGPGGN